MFGIVLDLVVKLPVFAYFKIARVSIELAKHSAALALEEEPLRLMLNRGLGL